jgi:hypothetical protein
VSTLSEPAAVSKAEASAANKLRSILDRTSVSTSLLDGGELRELLSALEWFLPQVPGSGDFRFWSYEGLDGIYPLRTDVISSRSIEIYGLALLISDQTLIPLYARLAASDDGEAIAWVHCKMGELDRGAERRLIRVPYEHLNREMRKLRDRADPIAWAFTALRGTRPEAESTLHVVSRCCPVGCGVEVVLLRSIADASLFCFCSACSCAWRSPSSARRSSALETIEGIEKFAPSGVDVPTPVQISSGDLAPEVTSVLPLHEWGEQIAELNARIAQPVPGAASADV